MGGFGAAALAAHTVVNQLVYIVFQITVGLSHGASIIVSREIALGRIAAASGVGRLALVNGAAVMGVVALLYVIGPELVLRAVHGRLRPGRRARRRSGDAAVWRSPRCCSSPTARRTSASASYADWMTREAGFRATLLGYWAVGLPLALLLGPVADLGPVGVWFGLLAGLATTAGLLLTRFVHIAANRARPYPSRRI